MPLALWLAHRDDLAARGDVGVLLAPDDDPAALSSDIDRLPLIAVDFPQFTDGRGYSIGRLLRDRHGFRGELRAVGDVLRDQLYALAECGFTAFSIRDDRDPAEASSGFADFEAVYAPTSRTPQPWFRRRRRRRSARRARAERAGAPDRRGDRTAAAGRGPACAGGIRVELRRGGHGGDRPDRAQRAADSRVHARHRSAAGGDAGVDRAHARALRTADRRVHARSTAAAEIRPRQRQQPLLPERGIAQGVLRRAQVRAAAARAGGEGRLDHRPAASAVGHADRGGAGRIRCRPRPSEVQSARRVDRRGRLDVSARAPRPLQRVARPRVSEHRLRALHACGQARRGSARRPVVVGSPEHKECGLHVRPAGSGSRDRVAIEEGVPT